MQNNRNDQAGSGIDPAKMEKMTTQDLIAIVNRARAYEPDVVSRAMELLGERKAKEAAPFIKAHLKSEFLEVGAAAQEALGKIGPVEGNGKADALATRVSEEIEKSGYVDDTRKSLKNMLASVTRKNKPETLEELAALIREIMKNPSANGFEPTNESKFRGVLNLLARIVEGLPEKQEAAPASGDFVIVERTGEKREAKADAGAAEEEAKRQAGEELARKVEEFAAYCGRALAEAGLQVTADWLVPLVRKGKATSTEGIAQLLARQLELHPGDDAVGRRVKNVNLMISRGKL